MKLQQLAALRPFSWQFVALTEIALRAGNNDVFGAIRSAARQGDDMIDVAFSFANYRSAIVTLAALVLILLLNIGWSVRTYGISLSCAPSMFCGAIDMGVSFAVTAMLVIDALFISGVKISQPGPLAFFVGLDPLKTIRFPFALRVLEFSLATPFGATRLAFGGQAESITGVLTSKEVLQITGLEFVTRCAALKNAGGINHDNLLKSSPIFVVGAELGNSVVRRVIKPSQAHHYYTMQVTP